MRNVLPAVVLFFLAPAIGELLSGSAPPVEFFNPIVFVILAALYGSGAVLVRELTIRWQKGWLSLFLLGAAYGIIEEGLMVKSFFDPNWVDLGILGSYGRWAGVNWVWCVELTLYHAVVSISIPILLVELIFPNRSNSVWVGKRVFIGLATLLAADVLFGYFFLTAYRPPLIPYILTIACVVVLIIAAWLLPHQPSSPKAVSARHPFWFWLTGFSGAIAFFVVFWGLPHTVLPPYVTILVGISLLIIIYRVVMQLSRKGATWQRLHRLALVSGPLGLLILLTPIHEFGETRTDNPAGMLIVGIITSIFLLCLWWRLKVAQKASQTTS